jgi:nucleotide-binding universal stress UspA family protein
MARSSRILHPSDFSPASARAFTEAVARAKADGAELMLVHVLAPVAPMVGDGYVAPQTIDAIERSGRQFAERRLAALASRVRKAGVRVTTRLLEGPPWQAITRAAKANRAGLIVMGTHGRGGLAKMFLGSVAERVIATAPCAVLTVRGR